ncbi:MAG: CoA pyrophosphatase [bacterium]|nr:CoA pyrophosphatase [bacterium]
MIYKNLARSLHSKRKRPPIIPGFTPSAVLVPIVLAESQSHLLYTMRTDRVRDHKNQISFPGGVREKGDRNLQVTALRETQEELGLDPAGIDVLGELEDIYTPTGYRITPFVGLISEPPSLVPNPGEIQEVIEVPLDHLLDPNNMKVERSEFFSQEFDMPFYYFKRHTIWGATGRITRELIDILRPGSKK